MRCRESVSLVQPNPVSHLPLVYRLLSCCLNLACGLYIAFSHCWVIESCTLADMDWLLALRLCKGQWGPWLDVMDQHLHNVNVRGLQEFRHDAAPVSLFSSNPPGWNSAISSNIRRLFPRLRLPAGPALDHHATFSLLWPREVHEFGHHDRMRKRK